MNRVELATLLASVFETPLGQAADDADELVRNRIAQRKRQRPPVPPRPPGHGAAAQPARKPAR